MLRWIWSLDVLLRQAVALYQAIRRLFQHPVLLLDHQYLAGVVHDDEVYFSIHRIFLVGPAPVDAVVYGIVSRQFGL